MGIFLIVKLIVVALFLITTGYVYTPIFENFRQKLSIAFSKTAKKAKFDESNLPDDMQCEEFRPKPSFLKFPKVQNTSCLWTKCVREKQIRWKLIIFVKSSTRNFALRELIRRTWASVITISDEQLQTVFVVGRSDNHQQALIDEEYERYRDILQVDIPDVFRNVHQKALAAMYWAHTNLHDDYYYAEADDDVMVNPFLVQVHMHEFRQSTSNRFWPEFPIVCMSKRMSFETPDRQSNSKRFYSLEQFVWPFWPDYCRSGLFACSVRIAGDLWKASRTGKMFEVADVYITGILREKIGLPRQMILEAKPSPTHHIQGFSALRPNEVLESLEKQWDKIKKESVDAEFCTCEKAV